MKMQKLGRFRLPVHRRKSIVQAQGFFLGIKSYMISCYNQLVVGYRFAVSYYRLEPVDVGKYLCYLFTQLSIK